MSAQDEVKLQFAPDDYEHMVDEITTLREQLAEVTEAFTVHLNAHNEEVPALRSQLDAVTRERDDHKAMYLDLWDAAKRHESERDQFASMLHDCENERDGWRHRAEQAERERDALQKFAVLQDAWELEAMGDITALFKERNELRHRAERMERVVEAARAMYDVLEPPRTENYREYRNASDALVAAIRALDATPTRGEG